jgi:hypothetical protein
MDSGLQPALRLPPEARENILRVCKIEIYIYIISWFDVIYLIQFRRGL